VLWEILYLNCYFNCTGKLDWWRGGSLRHSSLECRFLDSEFQFFPLLLLVGHIFLGLMVKNCYVDVLRLFFFWSNVH